MNKKLKMLKKYCPEIVTVMNLTKMQKLVEFKPLREHKNPTDREVREDKIRDNS